MKHTKFNSLPDVILNINNYSQEKKLINNIGALIASVFSLIFSFSIIREAYKFIQEQYVLVILTIFITLFLIFNEYQKVIELRKKFSHHLKGNLFIIILTFLISFFMSGIGIYLWTNRTLHYEAETGLKNSHMNNEIVLRYNHKIDSISSIRFEDTQEYNRINEDIKFWKGRRAASLVDRDSIRGQIKVLQKELSKYREAFNTSISSKIKVQKQSMESELSNISVEYKIENKFISRANKISFIFFIMVIITEIVIVYLAKERSYNDFLDYKLSQSHFGKQFKTNYIIATDILTRKDNIEKDDIKYCKFLRTSHTSGSIYKLFEELGITKLDEGRGNNVKMAQKLLKDYYNTILKF
jgi:hypothetical protein